MKRHDTAFYPKRPLPITAELRDLLRCRTEPFLYGAGINRPLGTLLEEAYLQGMRDAVQTMESPPLTEGETP